MVTCLSSTTIGNKNTELEPVGQQTGKIMKLNEAREMIAKIPKAATRAALTSWRV